MRVALDRTCPSCAAAASGRFCANGGTALAATEVTAVTVAPPLSEARDVACDAGGQADAEAWLDAVEAVQRGRIPTAVRALVPYFRARVTRESDAVAVETDFKQAVAAIRSYGAPLSLQAEPLVPKTRQARAYAIRWVNRRSGSSSRTLSRRSAMSAPRRSVARCPTARTPSSRLRGRCPWVS